MYGYFGLRQYFHLAFAENGPAAFALRAYPNPAQDYVLLQTGHSIRTVELFDVTGKKQPAAFQTSKLDLTGLAPACIGYA